MTPETAEKLIGVNRAFYAAVADPFAETRQRPQPGFAKLLPHLPRPCVTVLDVGCGNGRFGHFLRPHLPQMVYTGVDFTAELLAKGEELLPNAAFYRRDISRTGFLDGLGKFDLVVCLATMQHIPGRSNRQRLLAEMGAHLPAHGRLFLANWQFMESERQRRKVTAWEKVGLSAAAVEANDYLLTWQRGQFGLRYVCQVDAAETAVMARAAGLEIAAQFRSDGKEGDLTLYTVLQLT